MKRYIFPYGFELLENRRVFAFPAVTLSLTKKNSRKGFSFLVLVDSGAEISLFTKGDAELLEVPLSRGESIQIGSVSGDKFSAFVYTVVMKIGNEKLNIPVAFSTKDNTPRVLGRNPIFNHFFIIFDQQKQNTIFISRSDKNFEKEIYNSPRTQKSDV